MSRACEICNSKDRTELFNVPKDEKRRTAWSEACKMKLTTTALICAKHFGPSEFLTGKTVGKVRLKRNAMPFVDDNLCIKIKEEPEHELSTETQLEPLVKVEVENLIHEEIFDEHNTNVENRGPVNPIDIGADENKHLTCGRIVVELENESFKLNCTMDGCEHEFPITEYQDFVKHIKEAHTNTIWTKKTPADENKETANLEPNLDESVADTDVIKKELDTEDNGSGVDDDFQQSDDDLDADDDDFMPTRKKANQAKKKDKKTKMKKNTEVNKNGIKKSEDNMITFDTMPQKYVISFLELIKSNAILWHRRQSILKRFDETLAEVLKTFNATYPKYQLTHESARLSINRIRELYQRVTDPKHKRHIKSSTHKTKFPAFFELCTAIEENSKKVVYPCDKCLAFFFTEIDLQVHKAKTHRIGELPFKCSRCNYGFTKAEKRDEHEARHKLARAFVCEVCNRGFNSEEKLRAHSVIHSDDVKPVCEKCGQMFSTYNKYRRHKLRHEPPKEKCDICGKLFFEKWNLSEHIKSHLNERGYNCDICGKSFNHQNDVTIHKRGVHNVKPQKRRSRWVRKDEESTQKSENDDQDESSDNVYSDNYHYFRPMYMNESE